MEGLGQGSGVPNKVWPMKLMHGTKEVLGDQSGSGMGDDAKVVRAQPSSRHDGVWLLHYYIGVPALATGDGNAGAKSRGRAYQEKYR